MQLKRNFLTTFFLLTLIFGLKAQHYNYKLNHKDVFPIDEMRLNRNGWIIGLGPTYMLAYPGKSKSITYTDSLKNIGSNNFITRPKGKFGFMAELGWFHSFNNPIWFHFIDVDLSYKMLNGQETFTQQNWLNNKELSEINTDQTFSDQWLSLNVNLTRVWQPSDKFFITNAIGANGDYNIVGARSGGLVLPDNQLEFPNKILVDLHYKLGFGWHALPRLLIVPTIEMPIFACFPFKNIISTMPYFNSRYRPFLLSVRFMILRKKNVKCPPVYDPAAGKFPNKGNSGMQQQTK